MIFIKKAWNKLNNDFHAFLFIWLRSCYFSLRQKIAQNYNVSNSFLTIIWENVSFTRNVWMQFNHPFIPNNSKILSNIWVKLCSFSFKIYFLFTSTNFYFSDIRRLARYGLGIIKSWALKKTGIISKSRLDVIGMFKMKTNILAIVHCGLDNFIAQFNWFDFFWKIEIFILLFAQNHNLCYGMVIVSLCYFKKNSHD